MQDPDTSAGARQWWTDGVSNAVWVLRVALRWDPGVDNGVAEVEGPRRTSLEDIGVLRDDLRRFRREATEALIPASRIPVEQYEAPVHGTIFGPWPPVAWHRGPVAQ